MIVTCMLQDKDADVDTEDEKSGEDKEAGADGDKDDKKKDDKPVEPPKIKVLSFAQAIPVYSLVMSICSSTF